MKNKSIIVAAGMLLLFFLFVPFELADALTIKKGDRIKIIDSTDHIYEGKISTIDSKSVTLDGSAEIRLHSNEIEQIYVWKKQRPGPTTIGFFVGLSCGLLAGYLDVSSENSEMVMEDHETERILIIGFSCASIGGVLGSLIKGYQEISHEDFFSSPVDIGINYNPLEKRIQLTANLAF